MLVLSRKIGERITISAEDWSALKPGDKIEIVLVDIPGSRVRFGIEAPETVKIMRNELLEAK